MRNHNRKNPPQKPDKLYICFILCIFFFFYPSIPQQVQTGMHSRKLGLFVNMHVCWNVRLHTRACWRSCVEFSCIQTTYECLNAAGNELATQRERVPTQQTMRRPGTGGNGISGGLQMCQLECERHVRYANEDGGHLFHSNLPQ